MGPLEQRAGYHDACGGWSDGHDAIAERLCEAFAIGDVLLVMDTPGGAVAGLEQGIARARAAKAKYGRRCTVQADEQIGSAGIAWAYGIADEIYGPPHSQFGSIGARGGHQSIAGMLAREGIEVTFFAWPNEGKVALASEKPLSDIGRERATRDIALFGEWFAGLVETSAIGQRRGLTRDVIVALGADVLTGQAAVDAGLADGVATLEEVTAYALQMAERGGEGETNMPGLRAEGDEKPDKDKPDAGRAEGDEKPEEQKCSACGAARVGVGGFCAGCGKAFAEDEPEAEDDEPPPSSKPKPEERASARTAIVRADKGLSLAPLLGIDERASAPAQRQAALDMRAIVERAVSLTGERDPQRVLAGLDVMGKDAANAKRYRSERNTAIGERDAAIKMGLADRLIACNSDSYTRADVFRDVIEGDKRVGVALTEEFAEMSVTRMRAIVERTEAKSTKRDPFQVTTIEDATAKAGAASPTKAPQVGAVITDAQIAQALKLPAVDALVKANPGRDPKLIAKTYLETVAANSARKVA